MTEQSIFCSSLLGDGGWVENVLVHTDAGGSILSIEAGDESHADTVLKGPVIPGMPNCHSHAFQRQMAGLAGAPGPSGTDSFWTWRDAMYRLANRLGPEAMEAIASWLYVEMLEAGYTSCAEFHYLHHQPDGQPFDAIEELGGRLLAAASRVGLALTLLPVLYCRAGFDQQDVEPEQLRFANQPDRYLELFERSLVRAGDHPHHEVGLGLHSLRAVSAAQIEQVLNGEAGRAAVIHIHVAEQPVEVAQCQAVYGARPVEWLLDHAPVDERWCLVHATHMQKSEYDSATGRGAVAGICPTTEADLGDGFFEAAYWLGRGGSLAVGSDSNLRVSPAEELRLLEFGLRLRTGRRNVVARDGLACGRSIYEAAAIGGGQALGQPVGRLAKGYRADLVELDPVHPMLQEIDHNDIIDRYLFGGSRDMIRSVFVGGRRTVHDGIHEARDAAAAGFVAVMEELAS